MVLDIEEQFAAAPKPQKRACSTEILPKSCTKSDVQARKDATGYDIPGIQTVYMKTYGCSHNFSDSEYMAGLLVKHGYAVSEDFNAADVFVLNSCTVKNPSEQHFITLLDRAKVTGKPVVVAGCVPQGDQKNSNWSNTSVIGTQQIHRVVEVVEEACRGNVVQLFSKSKDPKPGLDLPKVRRNQWIEIVPINVGCLNTCTYCKTKHARGNLSSWTVQEICERVKQVITEGVKEIRFTSEDTGAYGRDIGTDIVQLMKEVVKLLPDGVMLKIGMTNPPYILELLNDISEVLNHPNVYAFMHIPVQAASNKVLSQMKREYTAEEFRHVCDVLREKVPNITISTDIICGFPGETDDEFTETLEMVAKYKFPVLNISQFYPRPGTPAVNMPQVLSQVKKERSRKLTQLFDSYTCYDYLLGQTRRVWITEIAHDGYHLVGHTKEYVQVLIPPESAAIGTDVVCKITEVNKWSVRGEVVAPNGSSDPTESTSASAIIPNKTARQIKKQSKADETPETPTSSSSSSSSADNIIDTTTSGIPHAIVTKRADAYRNKHFVFVVLVLLISILLPYVTRWSFQRA